MKKKRIIVIIAAIVVIATIGIVVMNVTKCDFPGCKSRSISNSKYCYAHTCNEEGCNNRKDARDKHCPIHKYESEVDTFDVVTGAELIRKEDNSEKYSDVTYYYTGGETESECRELIRKYQDYLAANTDWEWINSDEPDKEYALYDINNSSTQYLDIKMLQEEGVFTIEVEVEG